MKKFVSILLAVCILVTMIAVAAVSVSAVTTREIKFTNSQNWGSVYAYCWNDNTGDEAAAWPGIKMTDAGTNDYGEKQVKASVPTDSTNIIFSDGNSNQTVDLDYDNTVTGWYLTDQSNGKWNAATWTDEVTPTPQTTTAPAQDTTTAPVTGGTTITVGIISYVLDEVSTGYQVHYWNDSTNGDVALTALNKTEQKSVGQAYWNNEAQTFHMYSATIPADAKGFKVHAGDRWFGDDGVVATSNKAYIFNYDGDKALYEKSGDTPSQDTTSSQDTTTAPVTGGTTITVGIISYVLDEVSTGYQVHYWNDSTNGDVNVIALNKTEQKSVGQAYWNNEAQTFHMYSATIPADAKGFKVHAGDRWFGDDGVVATSNKVYIFNYDGDKALYEKSGDTPAQDTTSSQDTTTAPVTGGTTITVGIISYVLDEVSTGYQVHYWNDSTNGDVNVIALNKTEQKSVGQAYWNNEAQTFHMYSATIPADAKGFKVHAGDRWFGDDGVVATSNKVYIFNYDGDKALYEKSGDTPAQDTTAAPVTGGKTITVGIISYVMNEASTGYQVHYWNDNDNSDADLVALNKTEQKSVGQAYWNNEAQTFTMFKAVIPADSTGFIVHNGDRWFGEDGVVATSNKVYIFNYDGDKALYEYAAPVDETTTPVDETTTPVEETTAPPVTDDTEYYLFGYINGANYACEEDAENLGTYKFVDGKITAKFDADSYVAVRDNKGGWYMTDGWTEKATEVDLLPTTQLGEDADKMFVPADTEVTFTLTKTSTGFKLAYTTGTPVEETTAEPVEETTAEPVEETTAEPVEETTAEPVEETTAEPVEETTAEPVEETTAEPVEETTAEPVEETTAEPVEETTAEPEQPKESVLVGDIDGNGRVMITDVTRLQRFIAHFDGYIIAGKNLKAADTNGDGKVNIRDVTEIQRYLAKVETRYVNTRQMR